MRSKHLPLFLAVISLTLMLASAASAAPPNWTFHGAYRAPLGQVYFLPQDADAHHGVFNRNPWGLLSYRLWGKEFEFTFSGFNMGRHKSYTLIYYPGEGGGIICLGEGTSNRGGHLSIRASQNICSLPAETDPNYFLGARMMLVPNENVACEQGAFLNPGSEKNLISYHAIRFTDTDGCPLPETPVPPPAEEGDPAHEDGETTDPQGGETAEPENESDPYEEPYGGLPY